MRITDSSINFFSKNSQIKQTEINESVNLRVGIIPAENSTQTTGSPLNNPLSANSQPSAAGVLVTQELKSNPEDIQAPLSSKDLIAITVAEILLENATGKKVKLNIGNASGHRYDSQIKITLGEQRSESAGRIGWHIEYNRDESYLEEEKTSFQAEGIIKTTDGKEINIDIKMNLSRSFLQQHSINLQAGNMQLVDPLVINYSGNAAELTGEKFEFDLTSDGKKDLISFVKPGSGFLALDLNNNGVIDNGSELFGTKTGNGFQELAQYDEDRNNWIDELDSVFNHLRIWVKEQDGSDRLFTLQEKGIGAIYLGHGEAAFSYKDENNNLQGASRYAGIFLRETGTAGIIQQIDLAV